MLLSIVPLPEFAQFLIIILWITIPLLLLSLSLTALAHYQRKKKKKKEEESKERGWALTSPEEFLQNQPAGAQIFFDHTGLIQEYQDKLSYNHARYAALKQDFEKLELKYTSTIASGTTLLSTFKSTEMENTSTQNQEDAIQSEMPVNEKQELFTQLEQLSRDYKNLEAENASLLDRISLLSVPLERKDNDENKWNEDNTFLKGQGVEADYLKDLVEEKNKQVEFLQKQVELRIKSYHQSEHQREEIKRELESSVEQVNSVKNELLQERECRGELQSVIYQREEELAVKQRLLDSMQEHMNAIQGKLEEQKQHNEMLSASAAVSAAESHDFRTSLQEELEKERSKVLHLEQRLFANKQLLQHLYKEFSACMEDNQTSPVIALNPGYGNVAAAGQWDDSSV